MSELEEQAPQQPAWHARVTEQISSHHPSKNKVLAELVWGTATKDKNHITRVTGRVYHEIHGPTSPQSVMEMAEKLNKAGYVPPDKTPKTRADGFRQTLRNDSNSLPYQDFELPEQYR